MWGQWSEQMPKQGEWQPGEDHRKLIFGWHTTHRSTLTHTQAERKEEGQERERKENWCFLLAAQNLSFSPDHMRLHWLPTWRHYGLLWTNPLSFSSLVMGWRWLRMQMTFSDQLWHSWWSNISSITREGTFLVLHCLWSSCLHISRPQLASPKVEVAAWTHFILLPRFQGKNYWIPWKRSWSSYSFSLGQAPRLRKQSILIILTAPIKTFMKNDLSWEHTGKNEKNP